MRQFTPLITQKTTTSHHHPHPPFSTAHKNPNFVLGKPENKGFRPKKRTKMPILCSKCPKTRVPKGKSAQKPRFCAQKARKQGSRRPKKHKNPDFVLEMPENGKRLRDYVSAIKRKQGELPCYSFVHLSGRRSRYASEFEPGGKAAVLLSTSDR